MNVSAQSGDLADRFLRILMGVSGIDVNGKGMTISHSFKGDEHSIFNACGCNRGATAKP